MWRIALRMLLADRAKLSGLLFGIAFTSFLVTFAAAYFCGFMTQGFALVSENPATQVWVMDPAVSSTEQTTNMPDSALQRVRSVPGVARAVPLLLGQADARFANGSFQSFQVIGVDDATLAGAPALAGGRIAGLRARDAAIVDPGGTEGKLLTPVQARDQWPHDGAHLDAPTREVRAGDELLVNDRRVRVLDRTEQEARFPPRLLLYTTRSNALRILPQEARRLTFVMVSAAPGIDAQALARRIGQGTGLRARTASEFKRDTVSWFLVNSEDVGDIAAMLGLAMTIGLGVTGIMLYMFTYENQRHYAVLKALGAPARTLSAMVLLQALVCALLGIGIGLGVCGLAGIGVVMLGFPFRMMWFTPPLGVLAVALVSGVAALISLRPVLRLEPGVVFAGR
jgi:putative ABC transport system permease protein